MNVGLKNDSASSSECTVPAVFQVADHHDIDIFERTLRFLDRIKVEQRLTRMLVGPVSGIDHRTREISLA